MKVADNTYLLRCHGHWLCEINGLGQFVPSEQREAMPLTEDEVKQFFRYLLTDTGMRAENVEIIPFITAL